MHHHQQRLEDPPTSSLLVFLDGGGYCKKKSPPAAPPLLIYSYKKGASLGPLYTWECGGVCPAVDQLKKKRKKNSRDRMAQQRKTSLSLLGSDGSGHFLLYTQLWIGKRMQTNKSRSSSWAADQEKNEDDVQQLWRWRVASVSSLLSREYWSI